MAYPHWQYLVSLDDDLERLSRYIELSPDNYKTYSIELVRLLLAAASEVDVIAKMLCKLISPNGRYDNIDNYRPVILGRYPHFHTIEVRIPRYDLTLHPWNTWGAGNNPSWWHDYNKVKHQRSEHYADANLENCLNAVAGLFALVLYHARLAYGDILLEPFLRLLELEHSQGIVTSGRYELPDR